MRVFATAAIASLCLAGPGLAQEAAPQSPADAYKACIVGNSVVALLEDGYEGADAGIRALALCDYMVPDVPDAIAIENAFIELWDNRLYDLLVPEAE